MRKATFLLLTILLITIQIKQMVFAQGIDIKRNTFYLELLGNAGLFSFNYEYEISTNFSPRIGFSLLPFGHSSNSGTHSELSLVNTVLLNYFVDIKNNNKFELGIGITNLFDEDLSSGIEQFLITCSIGYRFSQRDGGFMYKITFTPFYSTDREEFYPWLGVGVGVRF